MIVAWQEDLGLLIGNSGLQIGNLGLLMGNSGLLIELMTTSRQPGLKVELFIGYC